MYCRARSSTPLVLPCRAIPLAAPQGWRSSATASSQARRVRIHSNRKGGDLEGGRAPTRSVAASAVSAVFHTQRFNLALAPPAACAPHRPGKPALFRLSRAGSALRQRPERPVGALSHPAVLLRPSHVTRPSRGAAGSRGRNRRLPPPSRGRELRGCTFAGPPGSGLLGRIGRETNCRRGFPAASSWALKPSPPRGKLRRWSCGTSRRRCAWRSSAVKRVADRRAEP